MNPEIMSPYNQPVADNRPAKIAKWLLVGVIILVVVLVLTLVFWPRPESKEYGLSKTSLDTEQSFAHLDGSQLYAYNGMAFYKIDLANGKMETLSTGKRLPTPNNIYWAGSRGALVDFSASFTLSEVERLIVSGEVELSGDMQRYSWFLDFESGSLKLVDRQPILPDLAYYSEKDGGFYYMTDQSELPHPKDSLHFYDIETSKTKVIADDLKIDNIGALKQCVTSDSLCFTARDQDNPITEKLYSVTKDGQKKVVLDSGGRLIPTNNPTFYVTVSNGEDAKAEHSGPQGVDHVHEADFTEEPAILHNIQTKQKYELGFNVYVAEPIVHFEDDERFYIIPGADESNGGREYRSGKLSGSSAGSVTHNLGYTDDSEFASQITYPVSHGSNGWMLTTTLDDDYVLFGDKKTQPSLPSNTLASVKKGVNACTKSHAKDSEYFEDEKMFRIYFTADSKFESNIEAFSKCLVKGNPAALYGYNFQFGGLDPVNGRILTD